MQLGSMPRASKTAARTPEGFVAAAVRRGVDRQRMAEVLARVGRFVLHRFRQAGLETDDRPEAILDAVERWSGGIAGDLDAYVADAANAASEAAARRKARPKNSMGLAWWQFTGAVLRLCHMASGASLYHAPLVGEVARWFAASLVTCGEGKEVARAQILAIVTSLLEGPAVVVAPSSRRRR